MQFFKVANVSNHESFILMLRYPTPWLPNTVSLYQQGRFQLKAHFFCFIVSVEGELPGHRVLNNMGIVQL